MIHIIIIVFLQLSNAMNNESIPSKKIHGQQTDGKQSSANDEQTGCIFKLNIDCLETIFDYLSLNELAAVGQTCMNFHQISGDYFHNHFFARVSGQTVKIYPEQSSLEINCFSQFVRRIRISYGDLDVFHSNHFNSLEEIEFYNSHLYSTEEIKDILAKVKTLKFSLCQFHADFHANFLSHCGTLKRLYVRQNEVGNRQKNLIGTSNDWLGRKYPTLEHFEVNSQCEMDEVIQFLKKNPIIRRLSATMEFLMANRDTIATSGIELDDLAILHSDGSNKQKFNAFMVQLGELQVRRFFKKLHLYFVRNVTELIYPSNLLPSITTLHKISESTFDAIALVSLEKLYLFDAFQIANLSTVLAKLTKLNYVYFVRESIKNILPFVISLPKLRKIQIHFIVGGPYFNFKRNILDLSALNDKRKKCGNAKKLTIYVNEEVYLATKKTLKGQPFSWIEIKRHNSYDGSHDFTFTHDTIS